jgi:hypothetical protein
MAFIGNTVQTQGFTPAIDYFNGDGVTVTFTLSRPVASVAQLIVAIDNVIQNPSSSFTVAGNAITFSSAPLSGTNNIWVEYTSLITTYQAISQDPTVIGDIRATGGYLAEGDFGNSFVSGAILDYVTGLGRVTVGPSEGIALYNGGTAARTALMTVGATGNVGIGTTSPAAKLDVTATFRSVSSAEVAPLSGKGIEIWYPSASDFGRVACYDRTGAAYKNLYIDGANLYLNSQTSGNVGIGTTSPSTRLQVTNASGSGTGVVNTLRVQHLGTTAGDGAKLLFTAGASTDGAGIASTGVALNSADLRFYAGGNTERMRIDSSGFVTMPFQPAFYGFRNGGNVTGNAVVVHNAVITNIGSCYNASTGVFTCPIAGVYEAMVGGHAENSQPVVLQIKQNSTVKSEEYSNGAAYGAVSCFAIMSCAAGDTITHVVSTGTFWGGNDSGLRMSVKLIG